MGNLTRIRIRIFSLIFILLSAFSSSAFQEADQNSFLIVQLTDTQFGFFNDNKSFEKETINFEKAVQAVNRLKPAFVVVTGDLVHQTFSNQQIAEYKRIASMVKPPIRVYDVPGNHDVGNTPAIRDIETYNKEFGPDYYTIKHKNVFAIVLNSLYLQSPENVKSKALEQEIWLKLQLDEAKRASYEHIIIFLHHSFFINTPDEEDAYFNIPVKTREKYLNLFREYNVSHIFAGHYHRNAFGKYGEMEMVTTGPVGKPLGKDPSGLRVISIIGRDIHHRYYSLDSIPERIKIE